MPSYDHKKLIEHIARIDTPPDDDVRFEHWVGGDAQLKLLEANTNDQEMIIYCAGPKTFIHSVAVPNSILASAEPDVFLSWNGGPYKSSASYVWSGSTQDLRIERDDAKPFQRDKGIEGVKDLIYERTFERRTGELRTYFEVNQEYTHLAGIHFRPEHDAYCKFDANGELAKIVSISVRSDEPHVSLVTFQWETLEKYLAASDMSLVRLFDIALVKREEFSGWGNKTEEVVALSPEFRFRRGRATNACYAWGYQIVRIRSPRDQICRNIRDGWFGDSPRVYEEFIAHDWRNNVIRKISTDPKATTSYFAAKYNNLPFDVSPAFFRPEVLSKYKTDREKYTVTDRDVFCRSSWHLRHIDVNEAGQVHAYICDLRQLPHNEQLYWLSFNEKPKAEISRRAFTADIQGQFTDDVHPRNKILLKLSAWCASRTWWWDLRDKALLERANPPLTSSIDEWADAFMDLSKLTVEGFNTNEIKAALDRRGIAYENGDQSLRLLEKLVSKKRGSTTELAGLRMAHRIRSKVKAHAGTTEGRALADEAMTKHGSYAEHFKFVCQSISDELMLIEDNVA
jgi:hypothetical protein